MLFELRFSSGFDDIFYFLSRWFSVGIVSHTERDPDSIVTFVSREKLQSIMDLEKGFFFICGVAWRAYVMHDANGKLHMFCAPQLSKRLAVMRFFQYTPLRFFMPFQNGEFATLANRQASKFVYDVFVPLVQSILLKKNASFIHAGVLHGTQGGVVFCGQGGSGKTSATSYLCFKHPGKWSFLSDDLGIIDEQGKLFLNPMALNVYPYNTASFPELESFIYDSMSPLERLNWWARENFKSHKSALKRIAPPKKYIGTRNSSVHTIFHLERYDMHSPKIIKMSDVDFAKLEKNILLYELDNKQSIFTHTNIFVKAPGIQSIDEVGTTTAKIYQKAVQGKGIYLTYIPREWDPYTLGEFFVDTLQKLNAGQSITN